MDRHRLPTALQREFTSTAPMKSVSAYHREIISNAPNKLLIGSKLPIDVEKTNKAIELNSAIAQVNAIRSQQDRSKSIQRTSQKPMDGFAQLGADGSQPKSLPIPPARPLPPKPKREVEEEPAPAPKAPIKSDEEIKQSILKAEEQNKAAAGKAGTDMSAEDLMKSILEDLF